MCKARGRTSSKTSTAQTPLQPLAQAVDMDIDGPDNESDGLEDSDTSIPLFDIRGRRTAKVVDIRDGDTISIVMRHDGRLCQFNARMDNYDTVPLKKEAKNDKDFAREALLFLHSTLWDKMVEVQCNGFDKSNNLLVEVYLEGCSVNREMIGRGFGKPGRSNRKQPRLPDD